MSILSKILDFDLHKSKKDGARIFFIETPGIPDFLPVVVSSIDKSRFLINNSITKDNRIRSGAFISAEESIDEVIPSLLLKSLELSREKFNNCFSTALAAYNYIKRESGFDNQPSACFIPNLWTEDEIKEKLSGLNIDVDLMNSHCRIYRSNINFVCFLSKPDYVGLYTRLPGNMNSILLHNVKLGMSFYVI
jgi:hypothetical protein